MAVRLTYAGALAGGEGRPHRRQFAKPALVNTENDHGVRAATIAATHHECLHQGVRIPDPQAIDGVSPVGGALNLLRAFATGVLPLARASGCSLPGRNSPQVRRYKELRIVCRCAYVHAACGLDLESHPQLRATDFYTSHEALLLGYEQPSPRRFHHLQLVRDSGHMNLDRLSHPPSRPRHFEYFAASRTDRLKCGRR